MSGRNAVINVGITLVTEECCDCHVLFAIPQEMRNRLVNDHSRFYCPNGHGQSYTGKTDAQKERELRERAERQLEQARTRMHRAEQNAQAERRSAAAYKGQVTKLRKRVADGICPVPGCRRTFQNVARHVEGQHSKYLEEHPTLKEALT